MISTLLCEFTVWGVAQPQGNKSAFVRNGRAILVEGRRKESREAFAGWRASIATAARDWQQSHMGVVFFDGPISVTVEFYLPRPASAPKRVVYPDKRPDLDKLSRAIFDGLKGVLVSDDSKAVDLIARKRFAVGTAPHARIRIEALA